MTEKLPGQPFKTGVHYFDRYGPYSLTLTGEPTEKGYTVNNIIWWHFAHYPSRSSGLNKGDLCFAMTTDYELGQPRNQSTYMIGWNSTITHFNELSDLDGMRAYPSITCPKCGIHIHLTFKFIESPDLVYAANRSKYEMFNPSEAREQDDQRTDKEARTEAVS